MTKTGEIRIAERPVEHLPESVTAILQSFGRKPMLAGEGSDHVWVQFPSGGTGLFQGRLCCRAVGTFRICSELYRGNSGSLRGRKVGGRGCLWANLRPG